MPLIQWFDLAGVFVFAVSGALAAGRRRMDAFGIVAVALMPAVGGGTIRDLVLDVPVFWLAAPVYVWTALAAAGVTFAFLDLVSRNERLMVWFDAAGLAAFAAIGTHKTLTVTGEPVIAVMMGVVTAVAGGVMRDVVLNEIPLVLHREVYASAAFLGGIVYCALAGAGVDASTALWASAAATWALRAAGILRGWSLPRPR